MTIIEHPRLIDRVECDAYDCRSLIAFPPGTSAFHWAQIEGILRDAGWSVYRGRSTRHYCPMCVPGSGHKMRRAL